MCRIIMLVLGVALASFSNPLVRAQSPELMPRGSEKPSFDCAQAKTAAARLICADAELARLDWELGAAFQKRKLQLDAIEQPVFAGEELAWIRDRNERCGMVGKNDATTDVLASSKPCLASAIRERIAFLAQPESSLSRPASAGLSPHDSSRCESITDKQQRMACLERAGVPVINCSQPQNADDIAFCREAMSAPANQNNPQSSQSAKAAPLATAPAQPSQSIWPASPSSTEAQQFSKFDADYARRQREAGIDPDELAQKDIELGRSWNKLKGDLKILGERMAKPMRQSFVAIGVIAILVGFVKSRTFRKLVAVTLFIALGVWTMSKMVANNDYNPTHLLSDERSASAPPDVQWSMNKWIQNKIAGQAAGELAVCFHDAALISLQTGVRGDEQIKNAVVNLCKAQMALLFSTAKASGIPRDQQTSFASALVDEQVETVLRQGR